MVVWYALRFTGPPAVPGRSWNVRFEGVRRSADVWLNGVRIGGSGEPYAPFTVPATIAATRRAESARRPGRQPSGSRLVPAGLVELGRDRARRLAAAGRPGGARGPRRDAGARAVAIGAATCSSRAPCATSRGRACAQDRGAGQPAVGVGVQRPRAGARGGPGGAVPVSFRVRLPGRPELWSPSNPSLYGSRSRPSPARASSRSTRCASGCAACRSGRDPVPERASPVAARGRDPRGRRRPRRGAQPGRHRHDRLGAEVGRREHHPRSLPALRRAARRARRGRDHGLVTASGRPRRRAARARGRPHAGAGDAALDDPRRAQPPVGGRRLGRQRAVADARHDAGHALLPAPGDRAGAPARPGGAGRARHLLLPGLPGAAGLPKARRARDRELLRLVHRPPRAFDRELRRARAVPAPVARALPRAGAGRSRSSAPRGCTTGRQRSRARTSSRTTICAAHTRCSTGCRS